MFVYMLDEMRTFWCEYGWYRGVGGLRPFWFWDGGFN